MIDLPDPQPEAVVLLFRWSFQRIHRKSSVGSICFCVHGRQVDCPEFCLGFVVCATLVDPKTERKGEF